MHELCRVRTNKYDSFRWKHTLFGEKTPKKFAKRKLWFGTFSGITLWIIWIEHNDGMFNQEQWDESKMKHLIWDNLIMYAKIAWARVIKFVYSTEALLTLTFVDGAE